MAEHPNYKYRPRRRKHTKARAGGPATVANQSAPNNSSSTRTPTPSSSVTTRATPPVVSSDHFDERISPPYQNNNGYYSASNHHQHHLHNHQQAGNSNSNSMHTPESSPTQSPEPISGKSSAKGHPKLDTKLDENLPALPTPEMSPLELSERKMHDSYLEYTSKAEKMHGYARSNAGDNVLMMDGVAVSSSASGQLSSATYATSNNNNNNNNIKREYYGAETDLMAGKSAAISLSKYYESSVNSGRYLNSTSSPLPMVTTATVRGKGSMYVTCNNRGILDQGHTVKGTYFPPLPTSQDHQNLGTTTMSSSMSNANSGSGGALNYSSAMICNQQQLHNSHHQQMHNSHLNNNNPLIKNHNSGNGLMDSSAYYNNYQTPSPVTYYSKEYAYPGGEGPVTNGSNNNEEVQKGLYLVDSNHNYHDYESYNAIVTGAQYSTSSYSMASHGILASSPSHMMTTNHQMLPDYYETYMSAPTSGQQQQQQQNTASNLSAVEVPTTASIKMEHHNSPYQATHLNHSGLPPIQPHHLTTISASAQSNPPTTTEQQPIMTDDFSNILAGVRKTCYSN